MKTPRIFLALLLTSSLLTPKQAKAVDPTIPLADANAIIPTMVVSMIGLIYIVFFEIDKED